MAAVAAAVGKDEFIAHQRLAPVSFISYKADAITSVTLSLMLAQYVLALVLIARGVYNCREYAYSRKSGQQYVTDMFHNRNLELLKYQMFPQR